MTSFGTTKDGTQVHKISLAAGDLRVVLLTHGARVQSVRLAGVAHDLTLGSEDLAEYEGGHGYHGALIAPVVNRLTGARAPLSDRNLQLEMNFNGKHSLHSGPSGAHAQVWQVLRATATEAVLALDLPDGLGGFSGNRHIEAHAWPDAPNKPQFTPISLAVGQTRQQVTEWRFDRG